ncbi:hypothetical protein [Enhygromyxa salina]|uniref:Uncharacterized protein n=1 Tax=Enhygromyxa salina TaxID=215803 RepID=A0A2S9YMR2_9BACT|nr:hypothetical protein [Enhygromyxa salina]PRQ06377.1 hypothetical protein ENSA7_39230 [Enhygromyxa salina]
MIAYEMLVQTIADWKAGVRPTAPSMPPIPSGAPEVVEEFDSGVVDMDEGQYGEGEYAVDGDAQSQGEYAESDESEYAVDVEGDGDYAEQSGGYAAQSGGYAAQSGQYEEQTEQSDGQYSQPEYAQPEYAQPQPDDSAAQAYQDDDEQY